MTITNTGMRSILAQRRRMFAVLRRAARGLELRSFGLLPERFNMMEGYRAGFAVAVPLVAAVSLGDPRLSWAVFAAFWTCLCDAPGPDRMRRHLLAIFVVFGALAALFGAWLASLAPAAGMAVGPILVLVAIFATARIAYGGLLGTLLAVVAVVAVGFPHPLGQAVIQAGAFFAGASWAYLLINFLWRIDPHLPLQRATEAVVVRLLDMAASLDTTAERLPAPHGWYSEHRRAVRLSIERLRGLIDLYGGECEVTEAASRAHRAAEIIFAAMIALDQASLDRRDMPDERLAVARAYRRALLSWYLVLQDGATGDKQVIWSTGKARSLRGRLKTEVFVGCALALENALTILSTPLRADGSRSPQTGSGKDRRRGVARNVLRQALRQSAGLVAVYCAAMVFDLGYPYWASMAVIVVLQGGARVTWARCLERILGSLLGGMMALVVLHVVGEAVIARAVLAIALSAAAIALRLVNYTIFVVILTMLFITVTEIIQPGAGIASARIIDNVIGSLAAILAVFLLWPDFGVSLKRRIEEGIAANRAYLEAVQAEGPAAQIEAARRSAGLASIEAEIAFHDFGHIWRPFGSAKRDGEALHEIRNIAGEAAIAWHHRLAIDSKSALQPDA